MERVLNSPIILRNKITFITNKNDPSFNISTKLIDIFLDVKGTNWYDKKGNHFLQRKFLKLNSSWSLTTETVGIGNRNFLYLKGLQPGGLEDVFIHSAALTLTLTPHLFQHSVICSTCVYLDKSRQHNRAATKHIKQLILDFTTLR